MRLAAIFAALAAILGFGFIAVGASSAWCSSCHAMRPFADGQHAGAHARVACFRCHAASPAEFVALRVRELEDMWPATVTSFGRATVSGPGTGVGDGGCASCHAGMLDEIVARGGLRVRHATCAAGSSCVDCHSGSVHGKVTRAVLPLAMERCVACHDGKQATSACDACHAAKLVSQRLATGSWRVTHGPNWEKTHGLGQLDTCRACHPTDYCARCHGVELPHPDGFPRQHGMLAKAKRKQCLGCHDERAFCTPCHGVAMPHPVSFLPQHSKIASGFADPRCSRCHPRDTCDSCHAAHTHPGNTRGTLGGGALPKVGG